MVDVLKYLYGWTRFIHYGIPLSLSTRPIPLMPLDQTATFNLNVEEIPFLNLRELDQGCKS